MDTEQFKKLFERKFSDKRGSQLRGANALNMRQGNLSGYLRGTIAPVPQKYIDALNALPDYAPPSGITQEIYEGDGIQQLLTFFTARLTPEAAKNLEIAARFHTKGFSMPDLQADEDGTARLFEDMVQDYTAILCRDNAYAYYRIKKAIEQDKAQALAEFNSDIKRELVADELTENEINDDPLS